MPDYRNGAGGFDMGRVEFVGHGDSMYAVIIATEVKDYPNRWVPFGDFTAISENLEDNWNAYAESLEERAKTLPADQKAALMKAIKDKKFEVEIRVTEGTKIGSTDRTGSTSALTQLQNSVNRQFGSGTLTGIRGVSPESLAAAHPLVKNKKDAPQ